MARLQILELPEGSGDDRPPFVLVIDQCEGVTLELVETIEAHWKQTAQEIGAQGVLIFTETVDIPANDVPLDADGNPLFLKVHVEGEFEKFREQVQEEIRKAQGKLRDVLNNGPERTSKA